MTSPSRTPCPIPYAPRRCEAGALIAEMQRRRAKAAEERRAQDLAHETGVRSCSSRRVPFLLTAVLGMAVAASVDLKPRRP